MSSSPITSSLTQGVPNTSRPISAVVTASFTVRQPAVLGSTRRPSVVSCISRIKDQKPSPARLPPDSRRSDAVTMAAPDARTAAAISAGDENSAVPQSSREPKRSP